MNDLVVKKSGLPPTKQKYKRVCYKANPTGEESAAMGFSVRITETETGNNGVLCETGNRNKKQLMGLVARLAAGKLNSHIVADGRVYWNFGSKFSRVS